MQKCTTFNPWGGSAVHSRPYMHVFGLDVLPPTRGTRNPPSPLQAALSRQPHRAHLDPGPQTSIHLSPSPWRSPVYKVVYK
jgi:hypothetical protein